MSRTLLWVKELNVHWKGGILEIRFRYIPDVVTATGAVGEAIECVATYKDRRFGPGVAVCHPSDEFSEFYGEKTALKRMMDGTVCDLSEVPDVFAVVRDGKKIFKSSKKLEWKKEARVAVWKAFIDVHKRRGSEIISRPRPRNSRGGYLK